MHQLRDLHGVAASVMKFRRGIIGAMDEELKRLLETTAADTRRHFDVVAERLETRLDGLSEAVTIIDGKIDRKAAVIEEQMERGFTETQAMIKFSHAELDRRVRALEQAFAELHARVERLESTTH